MLRSMRMALRKANEEGGEDAAIALCLAADALLRRRGGIPSCLLPATAADAEQKNPHLTQSAQDAAQKCLLTPLTPLPQSRRDICARWGFIITEMSSSAEREEAAALAAQTLAKIISLPVHVHYEMARFTPFTQEEISSVLQTIGWSLADGGHLSTLLAARQEMRTRFQKEQALPAAAMLRLTLQDRLVTVWRGEWQDESRYSAAADPLEGLEGRITGRLGRVVL